MLVGADGAASARFGFPIPEGAREREPRRHSKEGERRYTGRDGDDHGPASSRVRRESKGTVKQECTRMIDIIEKPQRVIRKYRKDTVSDAAASVEHIFRVERLRQRWARTSQRTRPQGCAKRSSRGCCCAVSATPGVSMERKPAAVRDGGLDLSMVCNRRWSRIYCLPWTGCWR